MGFLDRLAGRPSAPPEEEQQQQQQQQPRPSTSDVLRDASATHGAHGDGGAAAARLYDPYEGISSAVGGRKALFQLPEGPEFVFQEEAAARRRGWGENMQFYTGLGYLGGGAAGFAIGGYRYAAQPASETAALVTAKLKANRLINMGGSLGRRFACGAAILGMYFASLEAAVYSTADGRLPDGVCTSAAGFLSAALFRSPRGPRTAAVAGAVGAAAAAGLHAARQKWPSL